MADDGEAYHVLVVIVCKDRLTLEIDVVHAGAALLVLNITFKPPAFGIVLLLVLDCLRDEQFFEQRRLGPSAARRADG